MPTPKCHFFNYINLQRFSKEKAMMKQFLMLSSMALLFLGIHNPAALMSASGSQEKAVVLKGKIFRSDTGQSIPNATILLNDGQKKAAESLPIQAQTDAKGEYIFEHLNVGKYTATIKVSYQRRDDAPCQQLAGKTAEKDSSVLVMPEGAGFLLRVYIDGVKIKGGKIALRDFDIACTSQFGIQGP
jgi:hypothetical protein